MTDQNNETIEMMEKQIAACESQLEAKQRAVIRLKLEEESNRRMNEYMDARIKELTDEFDEKKAAIDDIVADLGIDTDYEELARLAREIGGLKSVILRMMTPPSLMK